MWRGMSSSSVTRRHRGALMFLSGAGIALAVLSIYLFPAAMRRIGRSEQGEDGRTVSTFDDISFHGTVRVEKSLEFQEGSSIRSGTQGSPVHVEGNLYVGKELVAEDRIVVRESTSPPFRSESLPDSSLSPPQVHEIFTDAVDARRVGSVCLGDFEGGGPSACLHAEASESSAPWSAAVISVRTPVHANTSGEGESTGVGYLPLLRASVSEDDISVHVGGKLVVDGDLLTQGPLLLKGETCGHRSGEGDDESCVYTGPDGTKMIPALISSGAIVIEDGGALVLSPNSDLHFVSPNGTSVTLKGLWDDLFRLESSQAEIESLLKNFTSMTSAVGARVQESQDTITALAGTTLPSQLRSLETTVDTLKSQFAQFQNETDARVASLEPFFNETSWLVKRFFDGVQVQGATLTHYTLMELDHEHRIEALNQTVRAIAESLHGGDRAAFAQVVTGDLVVGGVNMTEFVQTVLDRTSGGYASLRDSLRTLEHQYNVLHPLALETNRTLNQLRRETAEREKEVDTASEKLQDLNQSYTALSNNVSDLVAWAVPFMHRVVSLESNLTTVEKEDRQLESRVKKLEDQGELIGKHFNEFELPGGTAAMRVRADEVTARELRAQSLRIALDGKTMTDVGTLINGLKNKQASLASTVSNDGGALNSTATELGTQSKSLEKNASVLKTNMSDLKGRVDAFFSRVDTLENNMLAFEAKDNADTKQLRALGSLTSSMAQVLRVDSDQGSGETNASIHADGLRVRSDVFLSGASLSHMIANTSRVCAKRAAEAENAMSNKAEESVHKINSIASGVHSDLDKIESEVQAMKSDLSDASSVISLGKSIEKKLQNGMVVVKQDTTEIHQEALRLEPRLKSTEKTINSFGGYVNLQASEQAEGIVATKVARLEEGFQVGSSGNQFSVDKDGRVSSDADFHVSKALEVGNLRVADSLVLPPGRDIKAGDVTISPGKHETKIHSDSATLEANTLSVDKSVHAKVSLDTPSLVVGNTRLQLDTGTFKTRYAPPSSSSSSSSSSVGTVLPRSLSFPGLQGASLDTLRVRGSEGWVLTSGCEVRYLSETGSVTPRDQQDALFKGTRESVENSGVTVATKRVLDMKQPKWLGVCAVPSYPLSMLGSSVPCNRLGILVGYGSDSRCVCVKGATGRFCGIGSGGFSGETKVLSPRIIPESDNVDVSLYRISSLWKRCTSSAVVLHTETIHHETYHHCAEKCATRNRDKSKIVCSGVCVNGATCTLMGADVVHHMHKGTAPSGTMDATMHVGWWAVF